LKKSLVNKVKERSTRLMYTRFKQMAPEDTIEAVILNGRVDGDRVEAIVPAEDLKRFTRQFHIHFTKKGHVLYRIVNGALTPIRWDNGKSIPEWWGTDAEKLSALTNWMAQEIVEGYKNE
jgi:hypothetical protein